MSVQLPDTSELEKLFKRIEDQLKEPVKPQPEPTKPEPAPTVQLPDTSKLEDLFTRIENELKKPEPEPEPIQVDPDKYPEPIGPTQPDPGQIYNPDKTPTENLFNLPAGSTATSNAPNQVMYGAPITINTGTPQSWNQPTATSDLEARVAVNEKNLVKIGQDLTWAGSKIAGYDLLKFPLIHKQLESLGQSAISATNRMDIMQTRAANKTKEIQDIHKELTALGAATDQRQKAIDDVWKKIKEIDARDNEKAATEGWQWPDIGQGFMNVGGWIDRNKYLIALTVGGIILLRLMMK